jgi:DNA processing protein
MRLEDLIILNLQRFTKRKENTKMLLRDFEEQGQFKGNFSAEDYKLAEEEIKKAEKLVVTILPYYSHSFPEQLRQIKQPPLILYVKGEIKTSDMLSVAFVGARRCTEYGRSISRNFSGELASLGVTIVSGLAYGIDASAHRGALERGGRTIAFLGSGIDFVYPESHKALYDQILGSGAVISEFPIATEPAPYNFPFRNRLISGFSLATVVIEAEEKSGSLITAGFAIEQGKDVFAVPGNITSGLSKGTNKLIKDGAIPLTDISDILENIKELNDFKKETARVVLDENETLILQSLENDPGTIEKISFETKIDPVNLTQTLTEMEFRGLVKKVAGRYVKIYES